MRTWPGKRPCCCCLGHFPGYSLERRLGILIDLSEPGLVQPTDPAGEDHFGTNRRPALVCDLLDQVFQIGYAGGDEYFSGHLLSCVDRLLSCVDRLRRWAGCWRAGVRLLDFSGGHTRRPRWELGHLRNPKRGRECQAHRATDDQNVRQLIHSVALVRVVIWSVTCPWSAACESRIRPREKRDAVGGGSVRRFEVNAFGGQSPLLHFDTAVF